MITYLAAAGLLSGLDLFLKEKAEQDPAKEKLHNPGFSFGFLKEKPAVVKGIPLISSAVFGVLWISSLIKKDPGPDRSALTLIVAGAFSNLYDRLKRGYVVDYLPGSIGKKKIWFNIADLCVAAGALLLAGAELTAYIRNVIICKYSAP